MSELTDLLPPGPVRLDEPDSLFLVLDGGVTLFTVGGGLSARRYLATIEAGGLLFGSAAGMLGDEAILAVPRDRSAILPLPWQDGGDGDDDSDPPEMFANGLAAWVTAVGAGIAQQIEPKPRPDLLVRAEPSPLALPAGHVIAASGATTWIDLGAAQADYCGLETVSGLIPLPPGAWLVLSQPAVVAVHDWSAGLAAPGWSAAVARFNTAMQELLPLVRGFADADEFNRVRAQEAVERQERRRTAAAFSGLIDASPPVAAIGSTTTGGLIDMVRLVAAGEDVIVRRPVKAARAQQDRLPTLEEIARASGFRTQPVALIEGWWRQDQGSLVAQLADGRSAALLRQGRGYVLIDETGRHRRVDAGVAAEVAPVAHALLAGYRPGPLKLSTLMRLSGRGGGRDTAAFVFALIAGSLLGQALPRATGFVFAMLVPAGMSGAIVQVAALVIVAGIAALLFQIALGVSRQRVDARSTSRAYAALWDRVLLLPLPYLSSRSPAELAAQAGAVISAQIGIRQLIMLGSATGGAMISALALILARQPALGLVAAAFVFIELTLAAFAGWGQTRAEQGQEQLEGNSDALLFDMIGGLSKLRAAGAESRAMLRWSDRFVAMRRVRTETQRITNLYESAHGGFAIAAAAMMFATISLLNHPTAGGRPIAISDVMVVNAAFSIMIVTIAQLVRALLALWLMKPTWAYAKRLLDEPAESFADRIDPGPLRGEIDISDLAFRYSGDTPPVLAGLSFAVQPGQFVAIVGASGSGKSTLIRLILGLLEPLAGAIYVDGHDVRALHPEAFRRQVGVVLQDMRLPPGSIGDIVSGGNDAPEADIWRALADAAVDRDIRAMPMGLHTMITDGGNTLSGGQLQRLALARIFLHQPALLLLDEATSALDATTQAAAMRSVLALPCTRLVIAHRISTIRDADMILVLHRGRIVQTGRYDDLAGIEGPFAELIGDRETIKP